MSIFRTLIAQINAGPEPYIPVEYQEVEYIESSGTQYINTNYYPYKTKAELQFQAPTRPTGDSQYVSGVYNVNNNRYYLVLFDPSDGYFRTCDRSANWYNGNLTSYNSNVHTIIYNDENYKVYFDGTTINKTVSDLTTQSSQPLVLFAYIDSTPKVAQFFTGRIMYLKLWDKDTNTMVRDLVPCYRKSDDEIGMYDRANGVFYTNAGTGTFTKGPNVIR